MSEPWNARPYQADGLYRLLRHKHYGLLYQPGLGKTSVVLSALAKFRERGEAPALVIAPLRVVHEVWPAEIARWDHTKHLSCEILHGPKKDRAAAEPADIYLMNPEGLPWLHERGWKAFPRKPRTLVVDESTAFKSPRSRRFKLLKPMLKLFDRRYILTGTPAPNGLLDLWAQIYVLDGGAALERYVTRYRDKYFTSGGYGGYSWTIKPGAEQVIYERVAPLVQHLASTDHLTMPERLDVPRYVTLPPKARRAYDELEKHFVLALEDGTITSANAAVATGKLRQAASGCIYDDAGNSHSLHTTKRDAVLELIEELQGQPLLVAYEYDHERIVLQEKLPDWPALSGRSTTAQVRQIVKAWNAGELPGLLVQPQAAGHGLNLQHGPCQTLLWTAGTWSLELAEQMVGRIWRQGQRADRIVIHRLIARNTIDHAVWARVDRKDAAQQGLLAFLKETYLGPPEARPNRAT